MIGFGQLKNNIEILKKYLTKMNAISQAQIKPIWIDEKFLKQNNPHVFLQLLHYFIVKFSPFVLFVKVLDFYPTIKDDSDKKFVSNVMLLARKMFEIDVKIDIQQFLSTKYLQKKTQFASTLCKAAYQYHIRQSKSSNSNFNSLSFDSKTKKQNQLSNYVPTKLQHKYVDDDQQDQEMPRNFNIAPTNTKKIITSTLKQDSQSSDQDYKQLIKQKNKLKQKTGVNKTKNNFQAQEFSNVLTNQIRNPKNILKNQKSSFEQTQQQSFINRLDNKKTIEKFPTNFTTQGEIKSKNIKTKNLRNKQKTANFQYQQKQGISYLNRKEIETQNVDYISREQFMEIVMGMNKNFTQLVGKFNQFQGQVAGWVQNVNAKISILEENVKTIKNNI